jgi:hypothetical protein
VLDRSRSIVLILGYDPGAPDVTKNPHAVALGRMGGLIGGAARAAALSPAKRKQIAAKAARARWGKKGE